MTGQPAVKPSAALGHSRAMWPVKFPAGNSRFAWPRQLSKSCLLLSQELAIGSWSSCSREFLPTEPAEGLSMRRHSQSKQLWSPPSWSRCSSSVLFEDRCEGGLCQRHPFWFEDFETQALNVTSDAHISGACMSLNFCRRTCGAYLILNYICTYSKHTITIPLICRCARRHQSENDLGNSETQHPRRTSFSEQETKECEQETKEFKQELTFGRLSAYKSAIWDLFPLLTNPTKMRGQKVRRGGCNDSMIGSNALGNILTSYFRCWTVSEAQHRHQSVRHWQGWAFVHEEKWFQKAMTQKKHQAKHVSKKPWHTKKSSFSFFLGWWFDLFRRRKASNNWPKRWRRGHPGRFFG